MEYIWSFDVSLSQTGVAIFAQDETLVHAFCISTKKEKTLGLKLKKIDSDIRELLETYPCDVVALERGFSRFNHATQALFRVHGVINLLFYDKVQIYYPPAVIKSSILGGKATKKDMIDKVKEMYGEVVINDDIADAIAIGLCYFKKGKS